MPDAITATSTVARWLSKHQEAVATRERVRSYEAEMELETDAVKRDKLMFRIREERDSLLDKALDAEGRLDWAVAACEKVGAPTPVASDTPENWYKRVWSWAEKKAGEAQAAHEGGGSVWEEPNSQLVRSFLP